MKLQEKMGFEMKIHLKKRLVLYWGRVAWNCLLMCKGEQLMNQWGRVSWLKLINWKKHKRRPKITLVEAAKKGNVNWGGDREYDFGYNRMVKKNTCCQPWLVY